MHVTRTSGGTHPPFRSVEPCPPPQSSSVPSPLACSERVSGPRRDAGSGRRCARPKHDNAHKSSSGGLCALPAAEIEGAHATRGCLYLSILCRRLSANHRPSVIRVDHVPCAPGPGSSANLAPSLASRRESGESTTRRRSEAGAPR